MYRGGSLSVSLLSNAEFSISRTQANPAVLPQFEQPSRTERPPRPLLPPSSPLPFSPSQWDRGERKERRESSYEVRACSCQPSLHLFPTPAGFLPDPFLSPRPKAKPRQKGNLFSSFILLQAFLLLLLHPRFQRGEFAQPIHPPNLLTVLFPHSFPAIVHFPLWRPESSSTQSLVCSPPVL